MNILEKLLMMDIIEELIKETYDNRRLEIQSSKETILQLKQMYPFFSSKKWVGKKHNDLHFNKLLSKFSMNFL